MSDVEAEPPRKKKKQLFVTSFLVPQIESVSNEPTDDPITNTGTPAPAAVAIEEMIAPDIAEALHLRRDGRLISELRRHFIESALKVPPDFQFPFSQTSRRKHYLNYNHMSGRNDCFYFSPSVSGLLCLPCVLFAPDKVGRGLVQSTGRLVTEPLKDFSKLTGKDGYLTTHVARSYHEDAVTKVKALKQASTSGDITVKVNSRHAEMIKRNREILRAVIGEVVTCGRMNVPLRGHRDSGPVSVPVSEEQINYREGNLRCLLQKAAIKDDVLTLHLTHGPRNASYISAETQNNLISCIGTVMLRQISLEVRAAKYFAIQADETTDCYKHEQLVMTVRYIDSNNEICESFVGFIEVTDTTGRNLADKLLEHTAALGLDKQYMVAQAYDGAAAMSGCYNGVQALIKDVCPSAVYVHCFSHCLNLVLSKAMDLPEIRFAVTGIQSACMYFKHSAKRVEELKQAVEKLCPSARHTRLKQYCETRWVERHDSVFIFLELYQPLTEVLRANGEICLLNQITSSHFVIAAVILSRILGVTKGVSESLQAQQTDLFIATGEIETVVATFTEWRTDENQFRQAFDAATEIHRANEDDPTVELEKPRLVGRQRNRNNVPCDNSYEYYKRVIWLPLLDCMLVELESRFGHHCKSVLRMSALIASKCVTMDFSELSECIDVYGSFLEDGATASQAEYERWQRKWRSVAKDERPSTVVGSLTACDSAIYPNISVLLHIFATIPVTTATAERSFSSLRLLKTYLRSTMTDERLNGLALLAIHRDIQFKFDDVIDQYVMQHNRRLRFD